MLKTIGIIDFSSVNSIIDSDAALQEERRDGTKKIIK